MGVCLLAQSYVSSSARAAFIASIKIILEVYDENFIVEHFDVEVPVKLLCSNFIMEQHANEF